MEGKILQIRYCGIDFDGTHYIGIHLNIARAMKYAKGQKSSRQDEMPLASQIRLQAFYKWYLDSVAPIIPLDKITRARYIIH